MIEEIWKAIAGYEGHYEVSNMGRVKSLPRIVKTFCKHKIGRYPMKGRIMAAEINKGYFALNLVLENMSRKVYVHQLVARAFLTNPEKLPEIDHKNMNRLDNRAENLEWVTQAENCARALRSMGLKGGVDIDRVLEIRSLRGNGERYVDIARRFGVTEKSVSKIIRGKTWKHLPQETPAAIGQLCLL